MCDNTSLLSSTMYIVDPRELQSLLNYFAKTTYTPKNSDPTAGEIMKKCIELMKVDYNLQVISNISGELSGHYPSQIPILEYEHGHGQNISGGPVASVRTTDTIYESLYDVPRLRDLINKARFARCRARFPLPVILFKGKYVCRSATLSGGPEIYGRSGLDYLFYGSESSADNTDNAESPEGAASVQQSDWLLFDRVRSQDIKLLKTLNVGTIIDFMVEKKKVKFGMNVTSSEKVDKENRYSDFNIISLPYPGCEFFKDFRDNNYCAEGLIFDWAQTHVDAAICVPEDPVAYQLKIKWDSYKAWDLVQITQNYMLLILKYLQDNNSGLLIHCISGWDRTPLFISLVRLSLWADGVAHQGLDAYQILYLTVAYDWMLFGHHLADRLSKGEEIFFFCFYMLKHLTGEQFSITAGRHKIRKHTEAPTAGERPPSAATAERAIPTAALVAPERTNSEKNVIRTDSDTHLEGMIFDHDLLGSNVSLNSSSSSVSTKSQEQQLVYLSSTDDTMMTVAGATALTVDSNSSLARSPQARRTSPVTVPVTSLLRQRQESSSSASVGSWQMITGTGSLKGSDSTSTIDSNGTNRGDASNSSQDSTCTLTDDDCAAAMAEICPNRKERLLKLREVFYSCYSSAVGLKFKTGDSSLGTLFGNIVEKVGFSQRN